MSRLPSRGEVNRITRAVQRLTRAGRTVIDLTESNPTQVGLPYPTNLLAPLGVAAGLRYRPHPLGLRTAREAVASEFARRGALIDPDHLVLSASTSEAYSWLFKLLCDPGDAVLVPQPSYPLFDYLTRLEGVATETYDLTYHGRWEVDLDSVAKGSQRVRAVLAVSPNNPTGSFLSEGEAAGLLEICRRRGWALIVDEVFADYPLEAPEAMTDIAARADVLAFTLGGASKCIGLPQVKLGWTLVGGPAPARDQALADLEIIADTFLSVSTPVQLAAPALLRDGVMVRAAIHDRVRHNLRASRRLVEGYPASDLLPVEGGWSAILRVPASRPEETIVLDLLERAHVLVHPGFFFDLPHEAFLIVSLLPSSETFAEGMELVLEHANS